MAYIICSILPNTSFSAEDPDFQGDDNDRINLFSTDEDLDLLVNATEWFLDGTFSHLPGT